MPRTSSYRTDQFFGLGITNGRDASGEGSFYAKPPANGFHKYPDRTVRTEDHDGYNATTLKRGYMRSLRTQADGIEVDVQKCAFQFNPNVLEQSVVQAEGLLNVFQSDPSQYAQPIPGNVSFGFELRFDRTMEVNNPVGGLGVPTAPQFNTTNPWELSDPSQVGVLRDLAALYSVIGQGIGGAQNEYLQKVLGDQLARENNDLVEKDAEYEKKVAAIPDFLAMNTGNVAFLLPVPVRIVFSSLYIVEGFVQSTSVQFTKFSTQMVPLQCSVAVNVDAKYIGFAKKDTFLSTSLAQEIKQFEQQQQQAVATQNAPSEAGAAAIGSVTVSVVPYPDVVLTAGKTTLYDFLFSSYPSYRSSRAVIKTKDGVDQTPITDKYDSGDITGIRVGGGIAVYGPYTAEVTNDLTQAGIKRYLSGRSNAPVKDRTVSGTNTINQNAPNKAAWEKATTSGVLGESVRDALVTPDNRTTAYYVVMYRASVGIKGTAEETTGNGEYFDVVLPNSGTYELKRTINLSWPTYGTDATGAVVPNTGPPVIARSVPGATSSVGGRS